MSACKKLTTTLSVAASVLLQACGGSESSAPAPVPNTTAPELIGRWQSDCINTTAKPSAGKPATFSKASGGTSGGGKSHRDTITFTQEGRSTYVSERFAKADCNSNTLTAVNRLESVYVVGNTTTDRYGGAAVELDYHTADFSVHSLFHLLSPVELKLGDEQASSTGKDGTSINNRYDGLGPLLSKQ